MILTAYIAKFLFVLIATIILKLYDLCYSMERAGLKEDAHKQEVKKILLNPRDIACC